MCLYGWSIDVEVLNIIKIEFEIFMIYIIIMDVDIGIYIKYVCFFYFWVILYYSDVSFIYLLDMNFYKIKIIGI